MSRFKRISMISQVLMVVPLLLCGGSVILAAEELTPEASATQIESPAIAPDTEADTCSNFTPAVQSDATTELDALFQTFSELAAAPGCKRCKDRPWCECTYQGRPRISCNPCCYQGVWDPYPVCFD